MTIQLETSNMNKMSSYTIMLIGNPMYKGNPVRRDHSFSGSVYHAARRAKFLVNRFKADDVCLIPVAPVAE